MARCHNDGRLRLRVQLTICVGARISSIPCARRPSPCALMSTLREHMQQGHFTDLTLVAVDGTEQHVHKLMLAAHRWVVLL